MNFIEAVILISKRDDLELCKDERELSGLYNSICVYKNGEFFSKLRWPTKDRMASVDEDLVEELSKEL